MTNLEKLLAGMGDDFEASNFEDGNFDLDTKTFQAIKGLPVNVQQNIARSIAAAKQSSAVNRGIVSKVGQATAGEVNTLIAESVGDLNLTVKRVGVNVAAPLPFILFGLNDLAAKYASTLKGLLSGLPAGTTLAITVNANGDIVFTYTLEGNSDTVTISNLGNINYQAFLSSMNNNYFATKYVLISISDETYNTQQFAQPLLFGLLSSLGLTGANQMIFRSRTNSWMYRKDRIEVVLPEQKITPDFSFAMSIIAVNNFEIGFDFFMSQRINMNKM